MQIYYYSWITNWWLLLNFDVLGALVVLMTTLLTLSDYVTAGTAGLGITSAMLFMNIGQESLCPQCSYHWKVDFGYDYAAIYKCSWSFSTPLACLMGLTPLPLVSMT